MPKRRLTYANVMSTLALIVAVAGIPTAVAVSGKIGTKQIKNQAVTANKLATGSVTSLKFGSLHMVRDTVRVSPNETAASCGTGEVLISGGGLAGASGTLHSSLPSGNGWVVEQASGTSPPTAFAVCLVG